MKKYYSARTGRKELDLPTLRVLFQHLFMDLAEAGYFEALYGDDRTVPTQTREGLQRELIVRLRKTDLWPIHSKCLEYSEDDLFDILEFLFDFVCVTGYQSLKIKLPSLEVGRADYRERVNELLRDYKSGYVLSEEGEILSLAEPGLDDLYQIDALDYDPENVERRVEAAIVKFRRHHSSMDDRRDAVRDLADVLEFLRPQLRQVLTSKDESDLFNIANNFGIRHHNKGQKTDYDESIWYSWMFHYYLATIHASLRLLRRENSVEFSCRAREFHEC